MTSLKDRYSAVAIALHWTIALFIIGNIGLAWRFDTLPHEAARGLVQLHKSIGLTVLILSVARLIWRLIVPPPPLPAYMPGWERGLAHLTHFGFYLMMLGSPLTGWAMSSLVHFPITLYGVVPWPVMSFLANLPHDQMTVARHLLGAAHGLLAKLAYVLITLHVAGALKHQFIGRDDVVARMIPFLKRWRLA